MKLIIAIINTEDSYEVQTRLTNAGYYLTKLATTGGFLKKGNTTLLIGTEDECVEKALEIIQNYSKQRMEKAPMTPFNDLGSFSNIQMVDIMVGGATIFVVDVNQFSKY